MILFREQHEEVNVIHIIMGDETEFQFDMSGHIVADITENIDPEKRNILFINRCKSEELLQDQLEYYKTKWEHVKKSKNESESNKLL